MNEELKKELIEYVNNILDCSPPYLELEKEQIEDLEKMIDQAALNAIKNGC